MDSEGDRRELYHLYDARMRLWAESSLAEVAAWLDPSVARLPVESFTKQSTALTAPFSNAPLLHADLVIAVGTDRLMHVEYETSPGPELVWRMYDYRGRIMREYPDRRLTQHVIVLGNGRLTGYDDLAARGFALDLNPVYLREHDPTECLSDPLLAPFAELARGSAQVREQSLGAAMRLLSSSGHRLAWEWRVTAKVLARIRLARAIIDRVGREHPMDIQQLMFEYLRDDEMGQQLIQVGREEGREEGRERLLLALIRVRFGDSPDARTAARMLADWDEDAAAAAITAATDPTSLLNSARPTSASHRPIQP